MHRSVTIHLFVSLVIGIAKGQFPAISPGTTPTVAATNTTKEIFSCETAQDAFESCLASNPTCDKCLAPTFAQSHTCNSLQNLLCVILTSTACGLGCQETCILVIQDYYNCLCNPTLTFQCAGIPETAPAIAPPPASPAPNPVPIPAPIPPPISAPSAPTAIAPIVDFADTENTACTDTRIAFDSCLMEHQQCYNCLSSTFTGEKSCNDLLGETCVRLTGTACGLVCRQYCKWAIENYFNCHCAEALPFGCPNIPSSASSTAGSNLTPAPVMLPSPTASSVPTPSPQSGLPQSQTPVSSLTTGMNDNDADSTTPNDSSNRENDIARATGPGTTSTSASQFRFSGTLGNLAALMTLFEIIWLLL